MLYDSYIKPLRLPLPVLMVRGEEREKHLGEGNTVTLQIKGLKLKPRKTKTKRQQQQGGGELSTAAAQAVTGADSFQTPGVVYYEGLFLYKHKQYHKAVPLLRQVQAREKTTWENIPSERLPMIRLYDFRLPAWHLSSTLLSLPWYTKPEIYKPHERIILCMIFSYGLDYRAMRFTNRLAPALTVQSYKKITREKKNCSPPDRIRL